MGRKSSRPSRPNDLLRWEREKRGWTQEKVAGLIGADPTMISRWERGARGTEPFYQEKLCELFGKDALELGFVDPITPGEAVSATESDKGVNRREAGKKIVSMVEGAFLANQVVLNPPLWERLSKVFERTSRIDEVGISGLEQNIRDYWNLRINIGYRNLLYGFSGHLETVIQLLQSSQSPASRQRLCALAGEIAQRMGAIYFDMNNYETARKYYNASIETAREAEDYTLWAIGLVRMSSLPIYDKEPQNALPLLQAARQLAQSSGAPTTLAWIASMEAEAYANLNEERACFQTLGQAEHIAERLGNKEDPYGIKFDYARFLGYKGVCHLRLQQPAEALSALSGIAGPSGAISSRQSSIVMTDLAAAYSQLGEVEEACKLATQALTKVDQTKSLLVIQRLLDVRHDMKPWQTSPAVKELDKQLVLRGALPA
jgi:transcriptional regulator with XRE-family HTH domain